MYLDHIAQAFETIPFARVRVREFIEQLRDESPIDADAIHEQMVVIEDDFFGNLQSLHGMLSPV